MLHSYSKLLLLIGAFFFQIQGHAQLTIKSALLDQNYKPAFTESYGKWGRWNVVKNTLGTIDNDAVEIIKRPYNNPKRDDNLARLAMLIAVDAQSTALFQQYVEPMDVLIRPYVSFPSLYTQYPAINRWTGGVDGYAYTTITGLYAAGLITGNDRMQEASTLATKAIIESYVVSHLVLKTAFARHRPARPLGNQSETDRDSQYPFVHSPLDWFNFHRPFFHSDAYGTGFPSFHATMYFSIASTMSRVYGNRWLPYSLCVGALLYDIRGHNHWVSELVMGAVIGEFIGKVVVDNYYEAKRKTLKKQQSDYADAPVERQKSRLIWGLGQTGGVYGPQLSLIF